MTNEYIKIDEIPTVKYYEIFEADPKWAAENLTKWVAEIFPAYMFKISPMDTIRYNYRFMYDNHLDYLKEHARKTLILNNPEIFFPKAFTNDELLNEVLEINPEYVVKTYPHIACIHIPEYMCKYYVDLMKQFPEKFANIDRGKACRVIPEYMLINDAESMSIINPEYLIEHNLFHILFEHNPEYLKQHKPYEYACIDLEGMIKHNPGYLCICNHEDMKKYMLENHIKLMMKYNPDYVLQHKPEYIEEYHKDFLTENYLPVEIAKKLT